MSKGAPIVAFLLLVVLAAALPRSIERRQPPSPQPPSEQPPGPGPKPGPGPSPRPPGPQTPSATPPTLGPGPGPRPPGPQPPSEQPPTSGPKPPGPGPQPPSPQPPSEQPPGPGPKPPGPKPPGPGPQPPSEQPPGPRPPGPRPPGPPPTGPAPPRDGELCELPPDEGPCEALSLQYYYNSTSGACEEFFYGGCDGNRNRFPTEKECRKKCAAKEGGTHCRNVSCPVINCSDPRPPRPGSCCHSCPEGPRCPIEGQVFNNCSSPCNATCSNPNPLCIGVCQPGCQCPSGHVIDEQRNRCVLVDSCPSLPLECRNVSCPVLNCSNPRPPRPGSCCPSCPGGPHCPIEGQVFNICSSPCNDPNPLCVTVCQPGCQCPSGHVIDQKRNKCVPVDSCPRDREFCKLPPDEGPCEALSLQYYYNSTSGTCEEFFYGGCDGNKNRFLTAEECQKHCADDVHEPPCSDGQVRHFNPQRRFLPVLNADVISGFLEVCYRGDWVSICLSEVPTIDTTQLAHLACKTFYGSKGYSIVVSDYDDDFSTNDTYSAVDYVCSDLADSLEDCNFLFNYTYYDSGSDCILHYNNAHLSCVVAQPRPCSEGDISIYPHLPYAGNGFESLGGKLEICHNGNFLGICNTTSYDASLHQDVCHQLGYTDYMNAQIDNAVFVNQVEVINKLDCQNSSLSSCTIGTTSAESCLSVVTITCTKTVPCYEGSIILGNEHIIYNYQDLGGFVEITGGTIEVCVNGTFLKMCGSASTDTVLANTVCQELGFASVYNVFTSSDANISSPVITSVSCPSSTSLENCDLEITDSCPFNSRDVIMIQCYVGISCDESTEHLYQNYTYYDSNNRTVITGTPLGCLNYQYITLCNDGTNDPSSADLLCTEYGFHDGGEFVYSTRSSPEGIVFYNNYSCGVDAHSTNDCEADLVSFCDAGPLGLTCYVPDPCATMECPKGSRCLLFAYTGEGYCNPSCSIENGGCNDNQLCIEAIPDCFFPSLHPCVGFVSCIDIDPCLLKKCSNGTACKVFDPTGEAYCEPSCELQNGGCSSDQTCELVTVNCIRAPCPPIVNCQVDCSKVDCPLVSCPNPDRADPANGICCNTCPQDSVCPIAGQIFSECGSACPATCVEPNPICIQVCSPGCHCPSGQFIDEQSNSCVTLEECPVTNICELPSETGNCRARIKRYYYNSDAGKCQSFYYGGCNGNENNFPTMRECQQTCESPDELTTDCSNVECPVLTCPDPIPPNPAEGICCSVCPPGSTCPIQGQIYHQCKGCPPTCDNYDQLIPCLLICEPGCACPFGEVLDEQSNTCVAPKDCPGTCELNPEVGLCKAALPRYFYNATSKQCEKFIYGGCGGNKNNFETLHGCEKNCSECAPTCTPDYCKGKLTSKCSIPSGGQDSVRSCFGDCDETICNACYYSDETLEMPPLDKGCPTVCPVDAKGEIFGMTCLKKWGKCARSANLAKYGRPTREMKSAENFKCWRPSCPSYYG